ncbi:hypothetical protein OQY15_13100 [Pedobacter sp. MC2016-15]|uniref:hypothetical protein n=1 Tax=Pedobacter sp. MC2016-15 TaxID=2994473 RepID=UPI002246DCF6|nr:hypothetical protein [Pedobacter sp. MC2016-15]MCX2480031.1 hypothetical protein [Pedobacter sp. MC2016-15]
MIKYKLIIATLMLTAGMTQAQAQFLKRLQQKLEDKVDKKVDGMINGPKGSSGTGSAAGKSTKPLPKLEEVYSFVPGRSLYFADNFATDAAGRMPRQWKSSGGGSIVTVPDVPGKWLALAPRTTYRIDSILAMPGNFTVEFDILTRSTQAKDIGALVFGFARDNSNRSYIQDAYNDNAITGTQLHFWNEDVNNASSDTKINNSLEYPLSNYGNTVLHVSMSIEGENMRVYLNRSKLVDTRMFKTNTIKYFYLSAPYDYEGEAMAYFSNLVISKL